MTKVRFSILPIVAAFLIVSCTKETRVTTASPEALRFYNEGVGLYEKFYYNEAKSAFENALKVDSAFAMAWTRLAMIDASNQDERGAQARITKAVEYGTRATLREQLFTRMWDARLHYAFERAADCADSLARLYPDEKEAFLFRGDLFAVDKNYDAAIRYYQKAIDIDTGYAIAVMTLGYAYSNMGEQGKAVAQMQRYIRLAPDAADPRASYADILYRAGRYDEALEQYEASLKVKPDYWYSVMQIGSVCRVQGRLHDAEDFFARALKLRPANKPLEASHLAQLAYMNCLREKYKEAIGQFQEALEMDTTNFNAAFGMVYALGKLKKFNEAERMIAGIAKEFGRRNLLRSSSMLDFYLMKGRFLTEMNRYGEAQEACDSALVYASPLTKGFVHRQLAEIYLKQKLYEPALDACEEALSNNPNNPDALLTLLRVYHARGDRDMTDEIGGRLLELWKSADPDFGFLIEVKHLLGSRRPT